MSFDKVVALRKLLSHPKLSGELQSFFNEKWDLLRNLG